MKVTLTESSGRISIRPSSNNTSFSPPSGTGSKRKALPEEKYDDDLTTGIGDDSSLSPLVIYGDLKISDMSGGNGYMNIHTISQQDLRFNNGDVICGNIFIHRQSLLMKLFDYI